ncbi:hypothetical protein [Aquimarina muelleri]|uniref:Uncharacterized protein n=1 Tax=Aquimarina muelleri TaxID=279356 RepID=A0A918JSS5_9FLAO|nr:hypothetical protein [Aquimarina muelleri]MCX2764707.1 hypothetical protein [Aquimarina muelleri]GGX05380.1 hypothetical protein GCM10007384_03850 [Aquimarina muelleri]
MALENLISLTLTPEEVKKLSKGIKDIQEVLQGKTVNLTPEQRGQYGRIANQNKLIVDKAKNYMEQHPNWIPRFLDKEEFDRDYSTRQQLETHVQQLENLAQQLVDTKTLLDHDNYTNALSFYRMMRFLAGENEPGAKTVYQDMKVLFNKNNIPNSGDTNSETVSI